LAVLLPPAAEHVVEEAKLRRDNTGQRQENESN